MYRMLLVVALLVLGSGCATVTRGTSEAFMVETDPPGADIRLSTGETCISPCTLTKKRRSKFKVTASLSGYESAEAEVKHKVAGSGAAGMAGNAIIGGFVGAAIDVGTGATQSLDPNPLVLTLMPLDSGEEIQQIDPSEEELAESFGWVPPEDEAFSQESRAE